jgi:hypothetical protein
MPEQLTAPPAPTPRADEPRGGLSALLPYAVQAVVIVAVFAAAGALAGVIWEWLWTPPTGLAVHHQWIQDESGLRDNFSGTGTYVLVAVVAGALVGAGVALLLSRSELVTLVAALGGSLVAGWVMLHVGMALGPADPHVLAKSAKDLTELPGQLTVSGKVWMRAFPGGTLIGLTIVFLGLSRHRAIRS